MQGDTPWRVRLGLWIMRGYTARAFTVARHTARENARLVALVRKLGGEPYPEEANDATL